MKAIVLASGGVDSTTCIALAAQRFGLANVVMVNVSYGQRNKQELKCAEAVADYYGIRKYNIDLAAIFKLGNCTLLEHSTKEVVHDTYEHQMTGITSEVPFRNGVMLSTVAALALSIFPGEQVSIYLGTHGSDFAYADCRPEFNKPMMEAILIGTRGMVDVIFPMEGKLKSEVIRQGLELGVPYQLTWSCYESGEKPCGKCAACLERIKSFRANGTIDPAEYAEV